MVFLLWKLCFRNMQWLSTRSFVWRKSLTWLPNLLVVIEQPINAIVQCRPAMIYWKKNKISHNQKSFVCLFSLWRSYYSRLLRLWRTTRQNCGSTPRICQFCHWYLGGWIWWEDACVFLCFSLNSFFCFSQILQVVFVRYYNMHFLILTMIFLFPFKLYFSVSLY